MISAEVWEQIKSFDGYVSNTTDAAQICSLQV